MIGLPKLALFWSDELMAWNGNNFLEFVDSILHLARLRFNISDNPPGQKKKTGLSRSFKVVEDQKVIFSSFELFS